MQWLDIDDMRERWPRLFATMQWQGNLSAAETAATIAAIRKKHECYGEAVVHYGGAYKLLSDARRSWPNIRKWMREWGFIPRCGGFD